MGLAFMFLVFLGVHSQACTTLQALQIKGQSVEDFICAAQDRTKNARSKSELAAFTMCKEQLLCDQCQFEAERLMTLGLV